MIRRSAQAILLCLAGCSLATLSVTSAFASPPEGFRSLFNGENLDGWYGKVSSSPEKFAQLPDEERKAKL